MNAEKLRHHVKHLQEMHDDLDKQIEQDYARFAEDALVKFLKKKKLQLKDEIEHFKRQISELEG